MARKAPSWVFRPIRMRVTHLHGSKSGLMAKVVSCLASPSCPGYEPPPGGRGLSPRGSSDRDWGSQSRGGRSRRAACSGGGGSYAGGDGWIRRPCICSWREGEEGSSTRLDEEESSLLLLLSRGRLLSNYRRIIMIDGYRWVDNVGREDFWDLLFFGVA